MAKRSAATLAVQAGILLSRIAGLVRERVLSHYLGLSDAAGAFSAALRIPNLLQTLFGEGALSASFIPVYARLLAEGKRDEARRVAGVVASLLALTMGVLVLLGVALARPLIDVVAPGFHGDVRELTIKLVAIMFPGTGLLALSAWCLGVLNSHRRFFLSYVAPVLWNIAIIAALLAWGTPHLSSAIGQIGQIGQIGKIGEIGNSGTIEPADVLERLAQFRLAERVGWATVVGAGLQFLVMLPSAIRCAGGIRLSLSLATAPVQTVLRNFGPAVISRGVVQLSAYIDQVLVSYLGPAATAAMRSAQTIYLLPVSLFGMAVSASELPAMSGMTGTSEEIAEKLRARLEAGLSRIAFFVVPSAAAFLFLGDVIAATLFQTGKFTAEDARLVWLILAGGAVGLLAATEARLLASAFWALGDTRTPLKFAVVRVLFTGGLGWLLALPVREALGFPASYGACALTASAGLSGWIEYALLRYALVARIGRFSAGGGAILRCWAAAMVPAGLAIFIHRALPIRTPWLAGGIVLSIYGLGYFAAAYALGVKEGRALVGRLRARVAR